MGTDSGAYKVVLVLHILTVVFGFGPLVLAGLYDTESSKRGRQHAFAVGEVQFAVLKIASYLVYLVFITGIALVMMSDQAWKFDSLWVSLAMLSYIVAIGIWHGTLIPNERRLNTLRRELAQMDGELLDGPPEQAVELADRTKRSAAMGAVLDLILVFIIYLMVFKPGM
jgi:uncharacterized membrane protein